MNPPIIATTLSGLFLKSEPWKKAHFAWFEKAARELDDPSVKEYANKKDYFKQVDKIMKRLYPDMTEEQRTTKARQMFFESVCKIISFDRKKYRNKDIIEFFNGLKKNYRLALITTNTKTAIDIILSLTKLRGLFNIIEYSEAHEKDDKKSVFERFVKHFGKPIIYISGDRKDSFDYCRENNIKCIFANLEEQEGSEGIDIINNLEELKKKFEEWKIENERENNNA